MKKLLITLVCVMSVNAWAVDCKKLDQLANKPEYDDYVGAYSFTVQGKPGFRSYFHSAPSKACKLNKTFLIPHDSVFAYNEFNNEHQTWLYVMFAGKNGSDTTSGWVKKQDFKMSGKIGPIQTD